jgi:microcompartment protein CcmL/EutN
MSNVKSLGFIESVGLVSALTAADAALKSANVRLIGRENSRGGGMITIKISGEIGAVNAAIQAARASSAKVQRVWSSQVIPRPARALGEIMVWNEETLGSKEWISSESESNDAAQKQESVDDNSAVVIASPVINNEITRSQEEVSRVCDIETNKYEHAQENTIGSAEEINETTSMEDNDDNQEKSSVILETSEPDAATQSPAMIEPTAENITTIANDKTNENPKVKTSSHRKQGGRGKKK